MIRAVIMLVVFAAGFFAGGLFPAYTTQYKEVLYARLDQVTTDLAPFQQIADRHHGGSMARLVDHHLASNDPTFHDEGVAIQAMLGNQQELSAAWSAMNESAFRQAIYLLETADSDVAGKARARFTPSLTLHPNTLLMATMSGLILCLLFAAGWSGLRFLFVRR